MKLMIVITGCPAAGKSTFAARLSREAGVPLLSKDQLKIALAQRLPFNCREEGRRLSQATVDVMLSAAGSLMAVGQPLILEANFRRDEGERIDELLQHYDYRCLTYLFSGDPQVLGRRFAQREFSPERHPANRLQVPLEELRFDEICAELEAFSTGDRIIPVDATFFDRVDFHALAHTALRELEGQGQDTIQNR